MEPTVGLVNHTTEKRGEKVGLQVDLGFAIDRSVRRIGELTYPGELFLDLDPFLVDLVDLFFRATIGALFQTIGRNRLTFFSTLL